MSVISAENRRALEPVISLSLIVGEEGITVRIVSIIPPFQARRRVMRCGGILYAVREQRYAMIRGRYAGKWGFPKGKKENGESERECALREVAEEVGIGSLGPPVARFVAAKDQVYYLYEVAECLPLSPVDTMEIEETGWFTLSEIHGMKPSLNGGAVAFLSWVKKWEMRGKGLEKQEEKSECDTEAL